VGRLNRLGFAFVLVLSVLALRAVALPFPAAEYYGTVNLDNYSAAPAGTCSW